MRRYRRLARLHRAVSLVAAGESLTDAAATAGFASPSHVGTAFHDTFGFPPSVVRHLTVRELPAGTAEDAGGGGGGTPA